MIAAAGPPSRCSSARNGRPSSGGVAEDIEVARRDANSREALRLIAGGVGHVFRVEAGDRGEGMAQTVPIFDAAGRDEARLLIFRGAGFEDRDETVGLGIRQGLQEHGVDHREQGSVGGDTEGERGRRQ